MNKKKLKQETIDIYNKSAQELAEYFENVGIRKKNIDLAFSFIKKITPEYWKLVVVMGGMLDIFYKKQMIIRG